MLLLHKCYLVATKSLVVAQRRLRAVRQLSQRDCEVVLRNCVVPAEVVELDVVELELLDGSPRQGFFGEPRRILEFSGPETFCC